MRHCSILILPLLLAGCGGHSVPESGSRLISETVQYAEIPGVDPNLLSLDIYAQSGAANAPVMVMFHGGSFVQGDKAGELLVHPKMDYYTERGWIFVSANYRLTDTSLPLGHPDQVSYPTHFEDSAAAVAWVHRNIGEYGGGDHVVLMGHSAGAHIVTQLATDERYLEAHDLSLRDLTGVIALDGFYDIEARMPLAAPYMRLVFTDDPAVHREASSPPYVEPGKAIPPMLVIYQDTPEHEGAQDLVDQLDGAGVSARGYRATGRTHSEIGADVGVPGDPLTTEVDAFLDSLPIAARGAS